MLWVPDDFWMHLYQVSPVQISKRSTSLRFLVNNFQHGIYMTVAPWLEGSLPWPAPAASTPQPARRWDDDFQSQIFGKGSLIRRIFLTRGYCLQFLFCCWEASYSRLILLGRCWDDIMMVWLVLGSGDAVIPWSIGVSLIRPLRSLFAVIRLSNLKWNQQKWWRVIGMSLDFTRIILVFQSSCSQFSPQYSNVFKRTKPTILWPGPIQWIPEEKCVYKSTIHTSLKATDLSKNIYINLVWKMVKAGENHDR